MVILMSSSKQWYITSFEGDTYRPRLELSDFVEETSVLYPRDDNNPYDFTVTVLRHR